MEQAMKDAEENAGKENKPEEQSDSMQEAEKSDAKPEEAKKGKTQFQRKNTDANQHRRSEHEHETIHQRAHFGAYND